MHHLSRYRPDVLAALFWPPEGAAWLRDCNRVRRDPLLHGRANQRAQSLCTFESHDRKARSVAAKDYVAPTQLERPDCNTSCDYDETTATNPVPAKTAARLEKDPAAAGVVPRLSHPGWLIRRPPLALLRGPVGRSTDRNLALPRDDFYLIRPRRLRKFKSAT